MESLLHEGHILGKSTYSQMIRLFRMNDGSITTYGAGLFINSIQKHRHFEHGGDTFTFGSHEAYYPDDALSIVILTNSESAFSRYELERLIGRKILKIPLPSSLSVELPADVGAEITGTFQTVGSAVAGNSKLIFSVHDGRAKVRIGSKNALLDYLGEGRFSVAGSSAHTSFQFHFANESADILGIYDFERLMARALRTQNEKRVKD